MSILSGPIEWEGPSVILCRYVSLPRNNNWPMNYRRTGQYYERRGRNVDKIFVHQTAGPNRAGREAAEKLAKWIIRAPKYGVVNGKKRRTGGGRGFPGVPYTFLIPHKPDVYMGKSVVYRMWDDQWITWHTRRHNKTGVGIAIAGSYYTRHSPKFSAYEPTSIAIDACQELIEDYLMDRYSLSKDDVCGHFDAGKSTCPGDDLEAWVRRFRGETVEWDRHEKPAPEDRRPLHTQSQRMHALSFLGYGEPGEPDAMSQEDYRMFVEAFQEDAKIVIDGIWGPLTERAIRRALYAQSKES